MMNFLKLRKLSLMTLLLGMNAAIAQPTHSPGGGANWFVSPNKTAIERSYLELDDVFIATDLALLQ